MSLKNLHKTLFFLSFFLSLSLVTFFFFLSFYCYFYLSDTWVYIDYVICVHVIHVTLEILSSAISGCILLPIIFEYIRLCSAFKVFVGYFTNVVDLHFTKFLLNFELLNWMSWLSIQCIIVSLFTAYILVFNIIQVYWILLQISYRSVILKTVFRLSFLILTSRNYCLPTDCWFFI